MSPLYDQVLKAASALPENERIQLIDSLIATLPAEEDGPLGDRWSEEIERRSAEIDAGTVELVPWEEVRQRVTGRLKGNG